MSESFPSTGSPRGGNSANSRALPPATDAKSTRLRADVMERFAAMYRARRFDESLFDLDEGYLQTTLSDDSRMPLPFFVEYNNAWWFEIVTAVEVPTAAYDPRSDSGFIVLDIFYGDDVLRAAQHVHFAGERVSRIRTYASSTFFSGQNPLVRLDNRGNAIWLETGYDLAASTAAARKFVDSSDGRGFARSEPTASAIARIAENLTELDARLAGAHGSTLSA